ncbi:hypothetical protein RA210_U240043 [Rubrivivax sp. A210]|nr:hypothetical protein RA210_U240043 [Rubrivivax sp. A210]
MKVSLISAQAHAIADVARGADPRRRRFGSGRRSLDQRGRCGSRHRRGMLVRSAVIPSPLVSVFAIAAQVLTLV